MQLSQFLSNNTSYYFHHINKNNNRKVSRLTKSIKLIATTNTTLIEIPQIAHTSRLDASLSCITYALPDLDSYLMHFASVLSQIYISFINIGS